MKNIQSLEDFLDESIDSNIQDEELQYYMFFDNLSTIKRNVESILALDPERVDSILKNGHDWAADHIAVANDNLDQVADFLLNPRENR